MAKTEFEIASFKTGRSWASWLEKNCDRSDGIWLRLFKKDSGIKSINHAEALEEALCYGWIDGQAKKYDEESWLQKFTPRRPKSLWSKRNIEHITRLTEEGKMKPSGKREVEKAKEDGRWEKAYDPPAAMEVPEDFLKELAKHKKAKAFFDTLNKTNLYSIAWRLQTAKKPETREKRLKAMIEMLKKGEKFH
jgi:uncharacterized protein YdeI (YjbR/CyaY-like superfamily)